MSIYPLYKENENSQTLNRAATRLSPSFLLSRLSWTLDVVHPAVLFSAGLRDPFSAQRWCPPSRAGSQRSRSSKTRLLASLSV